MAASGADISVTGTLRGGAVYPEIRNVCELPRWSCEEGSGSDTFFRFYHTRASYVFRISGFAPLIPSHNSGEAFQLFFGNGSEIKAYINEEFKACWENVSQLHNNSYLPASDKCSTGEMAGAQGLI